VVKRQRTNIRFCSESGKQLQQRAKRLTVFMGIKLCLVSVFELFKTVLFKRWYAKRFRRFFLLIKILETFNCTIKIVLSVLKGREKHEVYQDTISLFEYKYRLSSSVVSSRSTIKAATAKFEVYTALFSPWLTGLKTSNLSTRDVYMFYIVTVVRVHVLYCDSGTRACFVL
jgi:hypothetical protein